MSKHEHDKLIERAKLVITAHCEKDEEYIRDIIGALVDELQRKDAVIERLGDKALITASVSDHFTRFSVDTRLRDYGARINYANANRYPED